MPIPDKPVPSIPKYCNLRQALHWVAHEWVPKSIEYEKIYEDGNVQAFHLGTNLEKLEIEAAERLLMAFQGGEVLAYEFNSNDHERTLNSISKQIWQENLSSQIKWNDSIVIGDDGNLYTVQVRVDELFQWTGKGKVASSIEQDRRNVNYKIQPNQQEANTSRSRRGRKPTDESQQVEIINAFLAMSKKSLISFDRGGLKRAAEQIQLDFPKYRTGTIENFIRLEYNQLKNKG